MRFLISSSVLALVVSCASSQQVSVSPTASLPAPDLTAFVVKHGGKSSDVDAHVERAIASNGVTLSENEETANVLVKYTDSWSWDMVMYLKSLDVQMYNARSGMLIGTASFSNAALHSFPNVGDVANELVAKIMAKARLLPVKATPPTTIRSAAASDAPQPGVASPAQTAQVSILCSVENADVYIDGGFVGNAPLPEYRLAPGKHIIEVRSPGYQVWTRELIVAPGAPSRVVAQLLKVAGQ